MKQNTLIIAGLLLALVFAPGVLGANQNVTQENVTTLLNVQNSKPAVNTITLHDADNGVLDLTPATTAPITCEGQVFDEDGYADILKVNATIFHSSSSNDAADSHLVHYTNTSCDLYGGSGKTVNYDCNFNVWFHAEPGTWYCNVVVTDSTNEVNSTTPDDEVLGTLMAIDVVDGAINYGSVPVGRNTSTHGSGEQSKVVENEGNIIFDLNLDGFASTSGDGLAMDCSTNDIAVGYQRWSLASGIYDDATAFVNGGADVTAFSLAESTDTSGTPSVTTKDVYFNMMVPYTPIVAGACSGVMQFTAIQNA